MKICFASDVNYPNYTNRIQEATLKCFLEKKLYEHSFSYYITTNRPEDLIKYNNLNNVKVFGIEELRKTHEYSVKYELLPENPVGLYPAKYPWNLRRFVVEKAAKDGFDYIIYVDADTIIRENMTTEEIVTEIISKYEPNTVKTNAAIFKYSKDSTSEVFHLHEKYFQLIDKKFNNEDLDTLDGPCMVFIGKNNKSILNLVKNWHYFTEFGYKKEHGFGYDSNMHGNLSFSIPISNFKLKWEDYPFYPNHVFEDRYDADYKFIKENKLNYIKKNNKVVNKKIDNKKVSKTSKNLELPEYFKKYSCRKYFNEFSKILENYLKSISNDNPNILEIGVGTISLDPPAGRYHVPENMHSWKLENPDYKPGNSLRAIRDFLKTGNIYGIDIQPDCLIKEKRIKTFIFDSRSPKKTQEFIGDKTFDLIIDDSDRDPNIRIITFNNFYNSLSDKGFYVFENILDLNFLEEYFSHNKIPYIIIYNFMIFNKKNDFNLIG
jgi:hypothetical protein